MDGEGAAEAQNTVRQTVTRQKRVTPIEGATRFHDMLNTSDHKALNSISSVDTYPTEGISIFREGEDALNLYAITAGTVRICRHLENGDRQILAFLWPGDLFGLAENGCYVNSASTLSPAKILRFPLKRLEPLLEQDPELQFHLLVRANHDLRAAQRLIITLGQRDAYRRLATFLFEMSLHKASRDSGSERLRLPMPQSDVADYLGTTPETVSRALKRMEHDGILRRESSRILEIKDFGTLSRLARI